jgi:hypothetical protein
MDERQQHPVPASLTGSCPRSFDFVRDAHFAQDDRLPLPVCHPERSEGSTRSDFSGCEPERKLLEAILQDAIECWQACAVIARVWRVSGYSSMGKRQREYFEADRWFFGEYDNAPLFSFQQICDCLGLDPDFIRRRLLEWRDRQNPVPASLPGSCPRSFDFVRDAHCAQDDRTRE